MDENLYRPDEENTEGDETASSFENEDTEDITEDIPAAEEADCEKITDEFDPFDESGADTEDFDILSEDQTPPEKENVLPSKEARGRSGGCRSTPLTLLSIVSLSLAVITSALLIFCIFEINSLKAARANEPLPSVSTYNTNIWVNPEVIDYSDAVANAVAKVIDSAVIIESFRTENKDALDEPSSAGSGVLFSGGDSCTFVVTCNHVIESSKTIRVTLNNGDSYFADIIGTDIQTDLAVLRIAAAGLPTVTLPANDTPLLLGQTVIAIGNPLGVLSNSVSSGVVSALTRNVKIEGVRMELLQMDASVNSGNSGGGLFDINGQLIGIVNAKSADYSVEGIGFAIPFKTVTSVCSELIEKGYVSGRPSIGISFSTLTASNYSSVFKTHPDLKEFATESTSGFFGSQTRIIEGIYVTDASAVVGYAEGSDTLLFGDRITLIDGKSVSSSSDLRMHLFNHKAGDILEITVTRGGSTVVVRVILGQAK